MAYDENSFLAGVSVGRTLKGWASAGSGGGSIITDSITPLLEGSIIEISSPAGKVVDYACYEQENLRSVSLPNAETIGKEAFRDYAALEAVNLPNVMQISNTAFCRCTALETFVAPNVSFIGDSALGATHALKEVDLPHLTSIGYSAFASSGIQDFAGPWLGEVSNRAFEEAASLETVSIPAAKLVGSYAFNNCTALKKVDIGKNIASLGMYSFKNCTALEALILRAVQVAVLGTSALSVTGISKKTGYVYVPKTVVDDYKSNSKWATYAAQIRAIEDYPDICG